MTEEGLAPQVLTKLEPSKHRAEVPVPVPPRAVKAKVLSKVVAPCRVKVPGVEVDPMVLIEEAPEPKVLVRDAPVPIVDAPEEVRVEKAPVPGVVDPMGPGAANVAPLRLDALIVPDPVKSIDAPVPTVMVALLFVPEVITLKGTVTADREPDQTGAEPAPWERRTWPTVPASVPGIKAPENWTLPVTSSF